MNQAQRPKDQLDLITMLQSAPDTLEAIVAGLTTDQGRARVSETEWSISEIVVHIVFGEYAWFSRNWLMAERDRPEMEPLPDPDYSQRTTQESMQAFHRQRREDLDYLGKLAPEHWSRGGSHSHWGAIDILWAARHLAAHDAEHLAQIARLREQVRGG